VELLVKENATTKAFFKASIQCIVGNGEGREKRRHPCRAGPGELTKWLSRERSLLES
jgi:hypothetical protein